MTEVEGSFRHAPITHHALCGYGCAKKYKSNRSRWAVFLKKNAQKYPQMVIAHRFGCEEKSCNFVGENEYCSLLVEA
ncbi:MAG: hypothetical protein KIG47_05075, partial [Prevotellamassilia sp.]|nr:hypothetical protein [Prevotellamassilia sp.]